MNRCWAEIDLAALERNLRLIRKALPEGIRYVAVVKADAYGHGIRPTAARLMQSGVDLFAVANVQEASEIREMGSGWPILVLDRKRRVQVVSRAFLELTGKRRSEVLHQDLTELIPEPSKQPLLQALHGVESLHERGMGTG